MSIIIIIIIIFITVICSELMWQNLGTVSKSNDTFFASGIIQNKLESRLSAYLTEIYVNVKFEDDPLQERWKSG